MIRVRWMTAVAACLLAVQTAARAEQIDNPIYKLWSNFKPGASRTMTGSITMRGFSIDTELKDTLVEVTADHVVVETVSANTMNGRRSEMPAHKQTHAAKSDKKEDWREIGKEDVKAMDRTFHCRVIEGKAPMPATPGATPNAPAGDITTKAWIADEVPGGAVQMKISLPQGQEVTYILKSFQAK